MRNREDYKFFWGGYLGNFEDCLIMYDGHVFTSSEQLFMYFKASYFEDEEIVDKILKSTTPKEAKKLGRKVRGFDEEKWSKMKRLFMKTAVYNKFKQNTPLTCKLLHPDLRNKIFVEASPYDKIWGIGVGWNDPDLLTKEWGQNLLGEIIGEVRDELLKEYGYEK